MARGLVSAGVQAEVNHQRALIFGRHDVVTAILPRQVVLEERRVHRVVHRDTVGSDQQRVDHLRGPAVSDLVGNARDSGLQSVDGSGVVDDLSTASTSGLREVGVQGHVNGRGKAADLRRLPGELVPVSGAAGNRRVVVRGAETNEEVLDGELELRQQNLELRHTNVDALVAVNADQRETNALDEDIVNVRVKVDVVNVQVEARECLRGQRTVSTSANGRAEVEVIGERVRALKSTNGRGVSTSADAADTGDIVGRGNGTGSNPAEDRGGAAQLGTGHEVQQLRLLLNLDGDVALTVGDRHGGNRQARILAEPEEKGNPHLKGGLEELGRLGTAEDLNAAAGGLSGGGERGASAHQVVARMTIKGVLAAHQAVPAGALVGRHAVLVIVDIRLRRVVVQGVTVDAEISALHEASAGKVAIVQGTTAGQLHTTTSRARGKNVGKRQVDDIVVDATNSVRVSNLSAVKTTINIDNNVGNVSGKSVRGGVGDGNGGHNDLENHVVEEVTLLGNGEGNRAAEGGIAGVDLNLSVLISDSSEGTEVSVNKQNVRLLNIQKRGEFLTIRVTLRDTECRNFLNAAVKHISGHNHLIGLAIIDHQSKNTSGSHCVVSCNRVYQVGQKIKNN